MADEVRDKVNEYAKRGVVTRCVHGPMIPGRVFLLELSINSLGVYTMGKLLTHLYRELISLPQVGSHVFSVQENSVMEEVLDENIFTSDFIWGAEGIYMRGITPEDEKNENMGKGVRDDFFHKIMEEKIEKIQLVITTQDMPERNYMKGLEDATDIDKD